MTKKKKIIIAILAVLLLLAGIFYAQKSTGKYRVLSDSDFLSAEEKVYGLSGRHRSRAGSQQLIRVL